MHSKYSATIATLSVWCQQEQGIQGAVALGSQVREEIPGDEWSDLDVLLLADDPQALLRSNAWLAFLGQVVCTTVEETPLSWLSLTWSVKRILFADHRAVDFSIMPADRLDDVLAMNAEIHANGYQVIYDAHPDMLAAKVEATLAAVKVEPPGIPTEDALRRTVDDLLFQLMWVSKKIKRNELWVAVQGINQPINNRLLQLIEFYAAAVVPTPTLLRYEGRFLEQRIPRDLLERLTWCFARYDAADAIQTVRHLLDLTAWMAQAICEACHYPFPASQFATIRTLYGDMFGDAL
jgi:aminoglycoside 6-adenylyltransferase